MSDIDASALTWLEQFASALGVDSPDRSDVDTLLELAAVAAHSSHRQAAPVACWLAAKAGIGPAEALELARRVAP